jgi:hypothetical protein
MKILLRIVLSVVGVVALLLLIAYLDGRTLPVEHSVSVTGTVAAPPARVFALIAAVADGPAWRHEVKAVQLLPPDHGRDVWIEDLGQGVEMKFLALGSVPPPPPNPGIPDESKVLATRVVKLDDPGAGYGGTWTYELSETRSNDGYPATKLRITETGYIQPPIYRFMMAHIFGPTRNLDRYLQDIQAAAKGRR